MNAIEKINTLNLNGLLRKAAMEKIGKDTIMGILAERGTAKLLAEKLGFANSGALSVATGDLGWREVGHRGDSEKQENAPKTVKRMKGIIPSVTEVWASAQLMAAHCAAGGDSDTFEAPVITPDVFRSIPAFKMQRQGWLRHVNDKLGGIDSEASRDMRAWLGVPLTNNQAEIEENAKNTEKKKTMIAELAYSVNKVNSLLHELDFDSASIHAIQGLVDLVAKIGFQDDFGNLVY